MLLKDIILKYNLLALNIGDYTMPGADKLEYMLGRDIDKNTAQRIGNVSLGVEQSQSDDE